MTEQLKQILDKLVAQINNWNRGALTNEEEFLTSLKESNKNLAEELAKPQTPPEVKE